MVKSKKSAPSQSKKRQNKDESEISQTIGPEAKKQKSDQSKGNSFDKACDLIDWKMSWTEINDHAGLPEQSLNLQHWIYLKGTTDKTVSTQNATLEGKQHDQVISIAVRSSLIVERLSRNLVKDTNGQIFRLVGKICDLGDLDFSMASIDKFMNGFPEDWASVIAEERYLMYQYPEQQDQGTESHIQPAQLSSNLDDEDKNMSDRSSTLSCSDSDDDESYAPQESLDNHESKVSQHQMFPVSMFNDLNNLILHESEKVLQIEDKPELQEIAYRLKEIAEQAKEKRNKILNDDAHLNGLTSYQKIPLSVLDSLIRRLEGVIKYFDAECKSKEGPNIWVIRQLLYAIVDQSVTDLTIRKKYCEFYEFEQYFKLARNL